MLRSAGYKQEKRNTLIDGKKSSYRCWVRVDEDEEIERYQDIILETLKKHGISVQYAIQLLQGV